jgi:hypothetical protein
LFKEEIFTENPNVLDQLETSKSLDQLKMWLMKNKDHADHKYLNENCKGILLKAILAGNSKSREEVPWTNLVGSSPAYQEPAY